VIFGFGRSHHPLVVRPAEMDDCGAIAEIHAASFERPWSLIEFERMLAERNIVAHVAAGSEAAAGPAEGFVLSRVAGDEAEVLSIAVQPRRRGDGVGGRLLDAHRAALAFNRARALFLEVEVGNLPAIALYRRQGFAEVARRDAYYRKADGSAATAIVMRRAL